MSDIIKLLPDSVANQIAAGEVVQRPASVVKELLENSLDAGATDIKLIVKDAGRTLIQVTDNGKGMSETDARMCFERHATSKINDAKDLFALRTMGFRGEALASIASVARVEMKSRTEEDALGTEIIIEGSKVESQKACQCPKGTTIAVKNLFFNTPARRNFLKSDQVERNHISTEFIRVALSNPGVSFTWYHNNQIVTQADTGNLNQRIVNLFGKHFKTRLIPVDENTDILKINGFVVKPEFAKKKRGDQYFFVNNRFIRSPYLNHAVEFAFYELIPNDSYPSFFLFLDIDPTQIDVNVHPTKTEIKFQDEKTLYQLIKATVKRSLGKFNIVPSLDFENETGFENLQFDKNKPVSPPTITVNPNYNPFGDQSKTSYREGKNLVKRSNPQKWETLWPEKNNANSADIEDLPAEHENSKQTVISPDWDAGTEKSSGKKFLHLQGKYVVTSIKSGIMLIDQQLAHERILFEKHLKMMGSKKPGSQTLLFPEQIKLNEPDTRLLLEIKDDINALGFDIGEFGKTGFMINAIPVDLPENENLQHIIESILDNFKKNSADIHLETHVNLARSLAKSLSMKYGRTMSEEEMNALSDSLFSCEMPYTTPSGKPCLIVLGWDELANRFK